MKILTMQSNSCPYFAKKLPVIDESWSIFPNNYLAKWLKWPEFLGWSKFPRIHVNSFKAYTSFDHIFLWGISENVNFKQMIEYFHHDVIVMTLTRYSTFVIKKMHVYDFFSLDILWSLLINKMPTRFRSAQFGHPFSKSWLRPWSDTYEGVLIKNHFNGFLSGSCSFWIKRNPASNTGELGYDGPL